MDAFCRQVENGVAFGAFYAKAMLRPGVEFRRCRKYVMDSSGRWVLYCSHFCLYAFYRRFFPLSLSLVFFLPYVVVAYSLEPGRIYGERGLVA